MKLKALWANEHFFGLTERGDGGGNGGYGDTICSVHLIGNGIYLKHFKIGFYYNLR